LPAANRAAGNVGEVLRGNEGAKRPTDLAKLNPVGGACRRRSSYRLLSEVGAHTINLFLFNFHCLYN